MLTPAERYRSEILPYLTACIRDLNLRWCTSQGRMPTLGSRCWRAAWAARNARRRLFWGRGWTISAVSTGLWDKEVCWEDYGGGGAARR